MVSSKGTFCGWKALRWPWGTIIPNISCFFRETSKTIMSIQENMFQSQWFHLSKSSLFAAVFPPFHPWQGGLKAPSSASSNLDAPKEVSTSGTVQKKVVYKRRILYLVGGFNPSEKYSSNGKSSPNRGENKKCFKPPPSVWLETKQKGKTKGEPQFQKLLATPIYTYWFVQKHFRKKGLL